MARLPRIVLPGQPQLILQRGIHRQAIFYADDDYRFYLDTLKTAAGRYGGEVHAYVLMKNHVHLLITPHAEDSLVRILQHVGRCFVRYINHVYRRSGALWEGRYKAAVIDSACYLLMCYRYIELNPVRSGVVADPAQYPWSSYRAHALSEDNPLLLDHALYQALGWTTTERCTAYRALFGSAIDDEAVAAIREALRTGWVLGNDRFKAEIEAALDRRSAPVDET